MREPMHTISWQPGQVVPKEANSWAKDCSWHGRVADVTAPWLLMTGLLLFLLPWRIFAEGRNTVQQWELEGCWFRLLALLVILLGIACKEIFCITWSLSLSASAVSPLSLAAVLYLVYEKQRMDYREGVGGRDAGPGAGGENFPVLATRNYYPGLIIWNIRKVVTALGSRERKKGLAWDIFEPHIFQYIDIYSKCL